jgi:hypothetical protein
MSMMFRAAPVVTFLLAVLLSSCGKKEKIAEGEVLVEAERIAASKAQTPKDVQPYDEGLAWHEYHVKRLLAGKLDASTIRVAHWTVLSAKPVPVSTKKGEVMRLKLVPFDTFPELKNLNQSDTLDESFDAASVATPRFLDLSQPHAQATPPAALRYDYRGNVSEQMRLYWKLRGQLRAVVMGNSHATKGVNPRAIMDAENWGHPSMLNMAPAGSNNEQQCLMLRQYVLPMPKLEWLLWVVSARTFNAARSNDTRKYEEFITSPGWLYDQKHMSESWPVPARPTLVDTEELQQFMGPMGLDLWGSLIISKSLLPREADAQRKYVFEKCSNVDFTWSDDTFAKFCDTARLFTAKGVKVLIFTTPMHPLTKETAAADPDGTSHEGLREMVRHMEEFDKATPGLWFRDFNKGGAHEFPADEFYDSDHLDRSGSGRLGTMIQRWMQECRAQEPSGAAAAN